MAEGDGHDKATAEPQATRESGSLSATLWRGVDYVRRKLGGKSDSTHGDAASGEGTLTVPPIHEGTAPHIVGSEGVKPATAHVEGPPKSTEPAGEKVNLKDVEQTRKIAASSETSPEMLKQLAASSDRETLMKVAGNVKTPQDTLDALASKEITNYGRSDFIVRYYVASNPSTRPETLSNLSKDGERSVRENVAENPSTPLATLKEMGSSLHSRDDVMQRITRSLFKRANDSATSPEDLRELSQIYFPSAAGETQSVNKVVLGNPSTPPDVLSKAADFYTQYAGQRSGDRIEDFLYKEYANARKAIAANPNAPIETLAKLFGDKDYEVQNAAAKHLIELSNNPGTAADTIQKMANSEKAGVRAIAARGTASPGSVLAHLATDSSDAVRASVAANKNTPGDSIAVLATDSSVEVRKSVAGNESTPPGALSIVAKDVDDAVRATVASNPHISPEMLAKLAGDKVESVRVAAANNKNTSPETLAALSSDPAESVRDAVLKNPATPEASREKITAHEEQIAQQTTDAKSDATKPERLSELAASTDWRVRQSVAENAHTPKDTLAKLSKDERPEVVRKVAGNTSTPQETLNELATSEADTFTSRAALRNPSTSPDTLREIAEQRIAAGVRVTTERYWDLIDIAANPSTPPDVLNQLTGERGPVREEVAGNKSTPAITLGLLANVQSEDVRIAVAANESADARTLTRLADDRSPDVQEAVARNKKTSPETLEHLANAGTHVRSAVAGNPNTPPATLEYLSKDKDEEVRAAAAANLSNRAESGMVANSAEREGLDADLRSLGLDSSDTTGYKAETVNSISERMETKLAGRMRAGALEADAKDPDRLRQELGINEDELKRLSVTDIHALSERLKGRLMAFGIAADIAPGIARAVFHL